ncbi:DUF4446 family protein [Patescibacteria group bacterium]
MEQHFNLLVIGGAVWLFVLTLLIVWIIVSAQRLMKNVKKGNLIKIIDKIIRTEVQNSKSIKSLEKEISRLEAENKMDIQQLGLVRFNPFDETGGDHSFSLCLLDGYNSGIVITSLHTRQRTRTYLKRITKGKSQIALSKEEKKALTMAQSKRK